MAITAEQIETYFRQLEWPYNTREPGLWDSGYNGDNIRIRFVVRLTERWLYVNTLLPVKVRPECRLNLFDHLLRLNFSLNGVKLYLDMDDDVSLAMELPVGDLPVDLFERALYAVCVNADQHFVELIRLATDPAAISPLKPPAPVPKHRNGTDGTNGHA